MKIVGLVRRVILSILVLTLCLLLVGTVVFPTPASAESTGSISGHVYEEDGTTPIPNLVLCAVDAADDQRICWGHPLVEDFSGFHIGVATDSQGNIIAISRQNAGAYSPRLAKYTLGGTLLWEKSYHIGSAVAVDSQNNIIVTDTSGEDTESGYIFFVDTIKYDPWGNELWHVTTKDPPNWLCGYAIAVDSQDNVVVTGKNQNDVVCLIKYDSAGNELWQKIDPSFCPTAVAIDSHDNIVLTGIDWIGWMEVSKC